MAAIEKSSPPTAAIPNVSCDSKSLRAYLSRDTHTRVSLLSVEDFTSWCEKETLERLARDRPASLRARVDATKRFYRELLKPLEKNVFSADAAFENGDDSVEILSAKKAVAQARAAIDGITKYLNVEKEERGPETWSTSSSANADASTKSQQQKRLATQTKLAALVEKLPQLEATYETLISRSKTWHAMHDAHEELKKVGVEIGLDIIEGELAAAHRETGNDSSVKGASFESVGLGVIAKLVREGTLRCSPDMHMPEPLIKPKTLLLLNNVHLWMSHGEIDGVLMEVNDLDGAFVDERMGKQSGIKMERLMESNGNNSLDSTPPVTVLAIFECKRNPDDARLGVLKRACDLSWLSGDRKSYRPDAYVNKYYPTGHFTCGVHPISKIEVLNTADEVSKDTLTALLDTKNKSALVLTKASFRLFLDDEEKNKLDRLYAVTRPRTMCGLDIKVSWYTMDVYTQSVSIFSRTPKRQTYLGGARLGPSGSSR